MIYLAFIIPVITCLYLFVFKRKETVSWEYLAVLFPSLLAAAALQFGFIRYNTADTEYLGSYATCVRHCDAWNEWVHRTCTRTVGTGKHRHTVSYDCSYCQEHPEEWVAYLNTNDERNISHADYNKIVSLWGTPQVFVDMHRDYHTKDGDAQQYNWNHSWLTAYTYTDEHSYENRTQASETLYKFGEVSEEDKKFYGLYDYPNTYNTRKNGLLYMDQNPILGGNPDDSIVQRFAYINGFYGKSKQFRMYVCLFPNRSADAAEMQRALWKGGNKNELTLCIGTDSLYKAVNWVSSFSWCDDTSMEVALKDVILKQDSLDLYELGSCTIAALETDLWKRKEFKDFKYMSVDLSVTQYIVSVVLLILVNIGLAYWVITNEYRNRK